MFKPTTAPQDALILQLVPIVTQACEILRAEYQAYVAGGDFTVERNPIIHQLRKRTIVSINLLPML